MAKAKQVDASQEPDLVSLLLRADASTLESVEKELRTLQAEIDQFVSSRKARLDALRSLHKLIDVAVHGKPAKATRGAKPVGPTKTDDNIRRIRELLDKQGSMPLPAIAAYLQMPAVVVGKIVKNSPLFEARDGEVHLVG